MLKYCLLFLLVSSVHSIKADEILSSKEWNFGTIHRDTPIEHELIISNGASEPLEIDVTRTCDCLLYAMPENITVAPGQKGTITLFYDPVNDAGQVEKVLIIRTNRQGNKEILFLIHGTVSEE